MSQSTATLPYLPLPPGMLAKRVNWDVFLSFRGEDTRYNITESLCHAFLSNGIRAFIDNQGMDRGDEIQPTLDEAIIDSAIAVAIISPNYADSHWCLTELSKIFKCRKRVIPVFYEVDPSNVRRQEGKFGKCFELMIETKRPRQSDVDIWRNALKEIGNIAGHTCRFPSDAPTVILQIVKQVMTELQNTPEYVAGITVGLGSRVDEVVEKLDIHSSDVRFLGIHGTPGIGKTTLAIAVFNKLAARFNTRCLISNVREKLATEGGVLSVQNKLIQDLCSGSVRPEKEERLGKSKIKEIVNEKRVLIVLDDVSEANQFERLGIVREWFKTGSRIIVTSRDVGVLRHLSCDDKELHEADKLNMSESLELFSIHALGRLEPTKEYLDISKKIVFLTGGLPLALEVFGSSLINKKTMREWEEYLSILSKTRDRPDKLQGVLKISYNGLDAQDKIAFLDISCLLIQMRMKRGDVVDILEGCGLRAELAIGNLVTKSLMKISERGELWMHDQIKDMGKQIVIEKRLDDLGRQSRLWDSDDIRRVLRYDKATRDIHGIVLDLAKPPKDVPIELLNWLRFQSHPSIKTAFNYLAVKFRNLFTRKADVDGISVLHTKSFEKMCDLKLLQINYAELRGNIKYMPSELRCLQWRGCSQKTLPGNIPEELRVLDVSESSIRQLWPSGWPCFGSNKVAPNLVVLNLSYNPHLTALPDMSSHKLLEKLTLERCVGLTKIHDSIGNLTSLVHLNLSGCSNLVEFSRDVTGMKRLKELILSGCSKFQGLPNDVRSMKSLTQLLLDDTAIVNLPEYMHCLTQLQVLNLNNCTRITQLPKWIMRLISLKDLSLIRLTNLRALPNSIGSLSSLEKLNLVHCSSLVTLPRSVKHLKSLVELHLGGTSLERLPSSICSLSYLRILSVGECRSLSILPVSIKRLASVTELNLSNTSITSLPDQIGSLTSIREFQMNNCKSLTTLPESIGKLLNLTKLWIVGAAIKQLPESIGGLENLTWLNLNKCSEMERLPESIGALTSLCILTIEETSVTFLPESFGMLKNLSELKMKKVHDSTGNGLFDDDGVDGLISVLPSSFGNLSQLQEFDARACRISGQIHENFVKLSKLEILNLGYNSFHSLPSTLEGLCYLKKLLLRHCEKLRCLPRIPSSLEELLCADCYALESISDLSNLHCLQELQLANCYKLTDVPGLECLKSLRRLYMVGCTTSASIAKRRLSRVTLKNLTNLSVPGSEIPDWFSKEPVNFSTRLNLEIKNVIVAVVVSVDIQKLGDIYAKLPNVVGIQARILRDNMAMFTTTLNLAGVPMTVQDQVHLCRFKPYHPLVSMLRDGDTIALMQKWEAAAGVELKKWGIFPVFENDDDYDGDDDTLPLEQQSVTQRLAQFFLSS